MSSRILLWATALILLSTQAAANNAYQQAQLELEANALSFTQAQGHAVVDAQALTDEHYYSKENFPGARDGQESINLPDADLDPITRSILFLEAQEARLVHVRYRITYSMDASADVPEAQQGYVEVTRYNVGPSLRGDLLMSVPDGQVADPAQFGVGPHVSWRFVLAPAMGVRAGLLHASRKEIPEAQARAANCLGEPCLSLVDPSGPDQGWTPITPPQLDRPAYVGTSALGVSQPARVMEELWENIASDGMDTLQYAPDEPHFVFVVSLNIDGQEAAVSGLAMQSLVMDGTVSQIWTQRHEVAQMPAEFSRLHVSRR